MQSQKFYVNTVERKWYDASGAAFASSMPEFIYKNTTRIEIQLCTSTRNAGGDIDPETDWVKDTQFDVDGITAYLSFDNDFRRHWLGTLADDVPAGATSSIDMTINGIVSNNIPSGGTIRLYADDGSAEAVDYVARKVSGSLVTFTTADGTELANSYSKGDEADAPDLLYAQTTLNIEESVPSTGLFVFDVVFDSEKLRAKFEYADLETLTDLKGMEFLLFASTDSGVDVLDRFLCTTCSIQSPMAEAFSSAQATPASNVNDILSIINARFASGVEFIFSSTGSDNAEDWHTTQEEGDAYFRMRLRGDSREWTSGNASDSGWSDSYELLKGDTGATGENGKDGLTCYVAFAEDAEGSGFTMNPELVTEQYAYIAFTNSATEPVEEDFAGKWVRYKQELKAKYVTYANNKGYYTSETVEDVLDEIGKTLNGLEELLASI